MTQFNPLTPSQIDQLKAYEKLSDKDKSGILEAVQNLEQMRSTGQTPSEDDIFTQLSATGHLEIGLACYVAQLKQIKWFQTTALKIDSEKEAMQ